MKDLQYYINKRKELLKNRIIVPSEPKESVLINKKHKKGDTK